ENPDRILPYKEIFQSVLFLHQIFLLFVFRKYFLLLLDLKLCFLQLMRLHKYFSRYCGEPLTTGNNFLMILDKVHIWCPSIFLKVYTVLQNELYGWKKQCFFHQTNLKMLPQKLWFEVV